MDEKPQHPQSNSENFKQMDHIGHVLIISYPLQGHAAPLIKLANTICKFGVKVTFLTTEFTLAKMGSSLLISEQDGKLITFASVPDGLEPDDDRNDPAKLAASIYKVMPGYLEDFVMKTNDSKNGYDKFTGFIVDTPLTSMLKVPKKLGIKCATYWCSSPGCLALGLNLEKLIQAKVIDANDGTPLISEKIPLLPDMPPMSPTEFTWYFQRNLDAQKSMFQFVQMFISHMVSESDLILCNWFSELDPSASSFNSNILSVGPILADGQTAGSFVSEDSSCLSWLDKQSPGSVVYVAFGSTSRFSQEQINEIALGLELMDRPFLWVAWSGLTVNGASLTFPDGFTGRVAHRGKIVEWAPQERVLAHPSVACFISHCGWGSIMESVSMGVPFLCWPYFGDQLYSQTCICEAWKIGIWLRAGENGIISRNEIKEKVDMLLLETSIRSNILKLKELARKSISKGGSSFKNLEYLVSQMKY
ncbi:UDP-glycosyltransferase 83A1-like [Coffea arabica]|uniref:UDP-glycosyltransferase 83A1-like n=2 Tax=Coffea TaxID=13442 RepID=A0A6P6XE58_COFAR